MGAFTVETAPRPAAAPVHSVLARAASATIGSQAATKLEMRLAGALATPALALSRQLPNIVVALLTPAALVALAMGLWRVGADLDWAGAFPITGGFFSHWQVWIGLSVALKMLSSALLAWDDRTRKISEQN
jgi:hypothetical protein